MQVPLPTASLPPWPPAAPVIERGHHRRKSGLLQRSRPPNGEVEVREVDTHNRVTDRLQCPPQCTASIPSFSCPKFRSNLHAGSAPHSKVMYLCGNGPVVHELLSSSILTSLHSCDQENVLRTTRECDSDAEDSPVSVDRQCETNATNEDVIYSYNERSLFYTGGVAHVQGFRISECDFTVPKMSLSAKSSFVNCNSNRKSSRYQEPVFHGYSLLKFMETRELRRKPFGVPRLTDLLITRSLLLLLLVIAALPTILVAEESPPRYSRDAMPNTSFTCDDKASGGYYADPDADCQMFHVCVRVSEDEIRDHKFLCPNDTIFDQQNFICASWWDTECKKQPTYDDKNELIRSNDPWATQAPVIEAEDKPIDEDEFYYDYLLEYENSNKPTGPSEYEYQYYDTGDTQSRTSGSRQDKDLDYKKQSVARSVSTSKSTVNELLPSSGYVISANVGSQSTLKPVLVTTSSSSERPVISTSTRQRDPQKDDTISTTTEAAFLSPFKASFEVGKPVVSISSTSSRFEVSSPRYLHSTPRYGYFSVVQPSTTPQYVHQSSSTFSTSTSSPRTTSSTSTTSTTTTPAPPRLSTSKPLDSQDDVAYENVKEFKAEDLASYSDSEDPFANIDWKRDSSGVTATTRTRYETAFGPAAVERRISSTLRPLARRRTTSPVSDNEETKNEAREPLKTVSVTSSSSSSVGSRTVVTATRLTGRQPRNQAFFSRGSPTKQDDTKEPESSPPQRRKRIYTGPSRQDFSNFRYFKTAFGNSKSSATTVKPTRPNRSRLSSVRIGQPVISKRRGRISSDTPAKTASRNTRYSIYA
ncbi:Chitin binding domain [Trinorchestia longiramus]|nr:Chitin binding domain [Trinorchestia longiramus]